MEPKLIACLDGAKEWRLDNGLLHRVDGPAIIYSNGSESWWLNGECHRADGPAIVWSDNYQAWYLRGKRHRVDGPAIIHSNGDRNWFLHGEHIRWKDVLKRIGQPGHVLSPLEVSMVEYHLEKTRGT